MIDQGSVPSLMGSTVRDGAGEKIGKVGQVYLDDTTGQPEWVTVRTGLFGTRQSFVPLAAARVEGDELVVDVTKDRVKDAPQIDEDGHLSEEQEAELYRYYGVDPGAFGQETGPTGGYDTTGTAAGYAPDATADTSYEPTGTGTAGYGADGGAEAPTRARLRRYAVSETEQVEAPVSREEVRREREPIADDQFGTPRER